ncbi:MAG: metal ABC transporter permease [Deltaproteobacteria bacterium]|nr:metal ABC transporter permease [Deltaproteobacteria bacterium]
MIEDILQYPFLQRAILASLLASITCGIIGSLIIAKRMSSFSGGLAHAVFGGIGCAHYFSFSPIVGAFGFSVLCSFLMSLAYRFGERAVETLVSIIWSLGMAIGVIFIALTPRYAPDLNSYLFGSILLVSEDYIFFVLVLNIFVLAILAILFKQLLSFCYDEEFSEISGVPVARLFLVVLLLTSCAVIMLIRVVGIILTIALLTLPATIAKQWTKGLAGMMFLSSIIAAVVMLLGLYLSYVFAAGDNLNLPSGPLIIVLLSLAYVFSSLLVMLRRKM